MKDPSELFNEYSQVLSRQQFVEEDLEYTLLEKHIPLLDSLARIGNSSISVFDLCRREHVYHSSTFHLMLGYNIGEIKDDRFFDSKIHPDDRLELMRNGINLLRFCFDLPIEERKDFKLVHEYRMENSKGEYVRMIEQHQALELDKHGNLWLALSLVDVSPDTDAVTGVKGRLINFRTGEMFTIPQIPQSGQSSAPALSTREQEVLGLIKDGLISKEIADRLHISVHTVNTHRQRILAKLDAGNSHEAITYASHLGLLD